MNYCDGSKRIRTAVIGCGRISSKHITAIIGNSTGASLVAVCDIVEERAHYAAQYYKNITGCLPAVYNNYEKMICEERIDLISVATESGKHASIGYDVLDAGISVIIEKPIALSLRDADLLIAKAESNHLVLSSCHQNRFNKPVQKIKNAVEKGDLGRVLYGTAQVRWSRGADYYNQAKWRGTWEQDGGALMNQCIHSVDLLRWLLGEMVTEVFAYTDRLIHPYIEAEDFGVALLKFDNGTYGVIEGTTNIYPANLEETLAIFGAEGTVKVGGKSVNKLEIWNLANDAQSIDEIMKEVNEDPPDIYGFGHTALYRDVIRAITTNEKPYIDGMAGRRALELVLAIYKSSQTGHPVKLPLSDFSTVDMKGRF